MPKPNRLRIVSDNETEKVDTSYEYLERQRIIGKDWALLHVRSDRSAPLPFFDRVRRTWRA